MLTWVIVKARIDSSLNLYEHCVRGQPCGANPAGQPCGAAYPAYPAFDLRCAPLFEVVKHLEKRCTATFFSKDGQRQCARRLCTSTNVSQRQNKRFLAYSRGILAAPRKKTRFGPIFGYLGDISPRFWAVGVSPYKLEWAAKIAVLPILVLWDDDKC